MLGALAAAISAATFQASETWLKDDAEAEFLLEPECGQNIVVPMGMEVDYPSSVESLNERLHRKIACGQFTRIGTCLFYLVSVFLCLNELCTNKCSRLRTRSGKRTAACSDGVGSIGELNSAHVFSRFVEDQQVVDLYRIVTEF